MVHDFLNAVNDPAPPETIMENGIGGVAAIGSDSNQKGQRKSKAEERLAVQAESITKIFGSIFTETVGPLVKSINGAGDDDTTTTTTREATAVGDTYHHQHRMMQSFHQLMDSIRAQIDIVTKSIDDANDSNETLGRKRKRLDTLNKMLDNSYSNLDGFV